MNLIIRQLKINLLVILGLFSSQINAQDLKFDPPHWYTGLENQEFGLLIRAKDIKNAKIEISEKTINYKVVPFSNSDYVWLEMQLPKELKPGFIEVIIHPARGKKIKSKFEFKNRGEWQGSELKPEDFIYLLMPDRFSDGGVKIKTAKTFYELRNSRDSAYGRHGGNLVGVNSKLKYLKDLGVSALWLNPVYENNQDYESYHGYAITNHYEVDERLGGNLEYKKLVDQAHEEGIKIIKDMVFNHLGSRHYLYEYLIDSSWFHFYDKNKMGENWRSNFRAGVLMDPYINSKDFAVFNEGWFDKHMPDLKVENPLVKKYLIQQSIWWILNFKIDALRIDTYAYPGLEFMQDWEIAMREEFEHLFIFSEIWEHGPGVQSFFNTGVNRNLANNKFKGTKYLTDFQFCFSVINACTQGLGWTTGINSFYYTISQDYLYEDASKQVTFLDNHDVDRIYGILKQDYKKWRSAMTLLMLHRGIPSILYGTEILMPYTGNHGVIRTDFPGGFKGDGINKFNEEGRTEIENQAFNHIKTLAGIRKEYISNARLQHYLPNDGLYVFNWKKNDKNLWVFMHFGDKYKKVNITEFKSSDQKVKVLLGEEMVADWEKVDEIGFEPWDIFVVAF